jgi:hypothetical protein
MKYALHILYRSPVIIVPSLSDPRIALASQAEEKAAGEAVLGVIGGQWFRNLRKASDGTMNETNVTSDEVASEEPLEQNISHFPAR